MILFLHGFSGSPESGNRLRDAMEGLTPGSTDNWVAPALLFHEGAKAAGAKTPGGGSGPRKSAPLPNGNPTTPAACWRMQVDRLIDDIRTNRPAHHRDELCEDAHSPVHVIGYSLGARVALSLAARLCTTSQTRLSSLTLIGVNPGVGEATHGHPPDEVASRRALDAARAKALLADEHTFWSEWEAMPLFRSELLPPEVRAWRQRIRRSHSAADLAAALRLFGLADMPPAPLEKIDAPTCLVAGSLDAKYVALSAKMAERMPNARLEIVEGAGHDVTLHAPDALAAIVLDAMSRADEQPLTNSQSSAEKQVPTTYGSIARRKTSSTSK